MSSSNPFGFVSGMFLEIGAVVAVLAILWQPSAGDSRPALEPDFLSSNPVRFPATPAAPYEPAARPALVREDVFAYRPLPTAYSQQPPVNRQHDWQNNERWLPSAPPMWERPPQATRLQETRLEAQPHVRSIGDDRPTFAGDRPVFARQPQREYAPAAYRTADGRNSEYHNRY